MDFYHFRKVDTDRSDQKVAAIIDKSFTCRLELAVGQAPRICELMSDNVIIGERIRCINYDTLQMFPDLRGSFKKKLKQRIAS